MTGPPEARREGVQLGREAALPRTWEPCWVLDQVLALFQSEMYVEEMITEVLFPGFHETYHDEWRRRFTHGFSAVWSRLDDDGRVKFYGRLIKGYRTCFGIDEMTLIEKFIAAKRRLGERVTSP